MARSTKDETKYTARREKVAQLYLSGKTQNELAKLLDVNQSTISRDLEAIRKQWQERALIHFDEIKARELARIDRLEREYWEAWERSQEDAEIAKQIGTVKDGKLTDGRAEKTKKGQSGNPSFLAGVQWCIEQRLKIFGVYEAVKLKIDGDYHALAASLGIAPDVVSELLNADAEKLATNLFAGTATNDSND